MAVEIDGGGRTGERGTTARVRGSDRGGDCRRIETVSQRVGVDEDRSRAQLRQSRRTVAMVRVGGRNDLVARVRCRAARSASLESQPEPLPTPMGVLRSNETAANWVFEALDRFSENEMASTQHILGWPPLSFRRKGPRCLSLEIDETAPA